MNTGFFALGMSAYFNREVGASGTVPDQAVGVVDELVTDQKFIAIISLLFGAGILGRAISGVVEFIGIDASVRYQACDHAVCPVPRTRTLHLEVRSGREYVEISARCMESPDRRSRRTP